MSAEDEDKGKLEDDKRGHGRVHRPPEGLDIANVGTILILSSFFDEGRALDGATYFLGPSRFVQPMGSFLSSRRKTEVRGGGSNPIWYRALKKEHLFLPSITYARLFTPVIAFLLF